MREILFRGKEIKTGEWVYGGYYEADFKRDGEDKPYYTDHCIYTRELSREHNPSFKVDPETVGQYTGMKDKNGEKIFEGDIVRGKDFGGLRREGTVRYVYTGTYEIVPDTKSEYRETNTTEWLYPAEEYLTIVGNIYDNPELLKDCAE